MNIPWAEPWLESISQTIQSAQFYFNPYSLPFLGAAIFILFFGSYIFSRGGSFLLRFSFLTVCVSFFLWLGGTFITYSAGNENCAMFGIYIVYSGVSFIMPSLCWYVAVWLNQVRKNKGYIILGFSLGLVFTVLIIKTNWIVYSLTKHFFGYHSRLSIPGGTLYLSFFTAHLLLFYGTLVRGLRAEQNEVIRQQIRFLMGSFIVANLGCSDFLPCFGLPVYPAGGFLLVTAFSMLGYTVIRYKLFNIETVIHRTIAWFMTTIVAISPFALFAYWIREWMGGLSPAAVTSYLMGLVLVFYFYYRAIEPRLNHLFRRRHANLRTVFGFFSGELVHLKSLEDLLSRFVETIQRSVYSRQIVVFLKDERADQYIPVRTTGIRKPESVAVSHSFVKLLSTQKDMMITDLMLSDPDLKEQKEIISSFLAGVQAVLAIPLAIEEKLLGFVTLGRKESLKKYSADEMHFLFQIRSPFVIALSNSLRLIEMQENLRKWNEELEEKVEQRTKELRETQEQLIQAEKLATIGTLAGGVAHEINNPLTAILTNVQILKMDARQDDFDSLDLIEEGAKRCREIVQKIMKYARKSTGPEQMARVDLNEVIANSMAFLEYQLKQENIELILELSKELPYIAGNRNELEQVITNLMINAKDAVLKMDRPPKIEVKSWVQKNKAGFSVRDNGVGIPKENLTKIFDPFFTTKDVGKGTGLGLAVAYGIVKKYNGLIEVSSQVGSGTTFTVTF